MANVRDPNKENRGLLTKLVKYKRKQKRLIKKGKIKQKKNPRYTTAIL